MANLIWTLEFSKDYCFSVYLSRDFAKKMIEAKVPNANQRRMNEFANEQLKDKSADHCSYYFHEDSGLVTQFNVFQGGVWLATNRDNIDSLLKNIESESPVTYIDHNVDHVYQAYALMAMFDLWVRSADFLIQK